MAKKQRRKLELLEPKMRKKKQEEGERERVTGVNMDGLKTEDLRSKTEKNKKNLQTCSVWGRKRRVLQNQKIICINVSILDVAKRKKIWKK